MGKIASRTRYIIKICSHEEDFSNKNDFICLLNSVNEGAEVTLFCSIPVPLLHRMNGHQWLVA